MRRQTIAASFASIALMGTAACATYSEVPTDRAAEARLSYANGLPAGTAQFYVTGAGELRVTGAFAGLSEGPHGFHLHTIGSCEAPGFQSAGGHLNPYSREHGTDNPAGAHLGDLPNLTAADDGTARITAVVSDDADDALAAIFDGDGTAVMIHAGADDYSSDPAGDAGARIACGVVIRR